MKRGLGTFGRALFAVAALTPTTEGRVRRHYRRPPRLKRTQTEDEAKEKMLGWGGERKSPHFQDYDHNLEGEMHMSETETQIPVAEGRALSAADAAEYHSNTVACGAGVAAPPRRRPLFMQHDRRFWYAQVFGLR